MTGALKHVVEYLMKEASAGNLRLAEAFALQELEGAITRAIAKGLLHDRKMYVRTSFAEWELIFETLEAIPKLKHAKFVPL